jgi:hypothetical protein
MREITSHKAHGTSDHIDITVREQPAHYRLVVSHRGNDKAPWADTEHLQELYFQAGEIQKVGSNGLTIEAVLAVLIDRMEWEQSGPLSSPEGQLALERARGALLALHSRPLTVAHGLDPDNYAAARPQG